MVRKKCMIVLAFLLCCSLLSISHPGTKDSDIHVNALTSGESQFIHTATVSDENTDYYQRLYSTPVDILSGSTEELLRYFLKSDFIAQRIFADGLMSSPGLAQDVDFTCHTAFRELVSRSDFASVLENYAGELLAEYESNTYDAAVIEILLAQSAVRSLISGSSVTSSNYPNIQSIYAAT